jgi:hypothetical protein
MKTSARWVLFLAGIVVLVLCVHYVLVPSWAIYPMIGRGFHRFGPRIFPWGSFTGLLTILVIGFVLYKLILPTSGSQATKEEEDFCPFCGRELRGSKPIPKTSPETPSPEEPGK